MRFNSILMIFVFLFARQIFPEDYIKVKTTWVDYNLPKDSGDFYFINNVWCITDATIDSLLAGFGLEEISKRQEFVPKEINDGAAAYSGYPISVKKEYYYYYPWDIVLSIPAHEVGHNLGAEFQFPGNHSWQNFDSIFHHGMWIVDFYVPLIIQKKLSSLPLSSIAKVSLNSWIQDRINGFGESSKNWENWLSQGGNIDNFPGDKTKPFQGLIFNLNRDFGPSSIEIVMRGLIKDRLPYSFNDHNLNEKQKIALLFALIASAIPNESKREAYLNGWIYDKDFYNQIFPEISKAIKSWPKFKKISTQSVVNFSGYTPQKSVTIKNLENSFLALNNSKINLGNKNKSINLFIKTNGDYVILYAKDLIQALNIEKSAPRVELSPIQSGWYSAQWEILKKDNRIQFKNRWNGQYLVAEKDGIFTSSEPQDWIIEETN